MQAKFPTRYRSILAKNLKASPWKNGQGTTREVYIYPEQAELSGSFGFRFSLAEVKQSGPFSPFPGYQRILTLVEGSELSLLHAGQEPVSLESFQPYYFSGDIPTEARVGEDVVHDCNLIYDPSRYRVLSQTVEGNYSTRLRGPHPSLLLLWVCTGDWVCQVPDSQLKLLAGDTLLYPWQGQDELVLQGKGKLLIFQIS